MHRENLPVQVKGSAQVRVKGEDSPEDGWWSGSDPSLVLFFTQVIRFSFFDSRGQPTETHLDNISHRCVQAPLVPTNQGVVRAGHKNTGLTAFLLQQKLTCILNPPIF